MEAGTRVLLQPGADVGVFVSAVVVDDQVQVELCGELTVEGAQELRELLVAVARQALADDAAVQGVEGPRPLCQPICERLVGPRL